MTGNDTPYPRFDELIKLKKDFEQLKFYIT